MLFNRLGKRLVGNELQTGVNREHHVVTALRLLHPDVFHNAAPAVADHAARARSARKRRVVRKFNALAPPVVLIGESNHVRGELAFGIVAAHLVVDHDARNAKRLNLLRKVHADLAGDVHEGLAALCLKALFQVGVVLTKELSQSAQLAVSDLREAFPRVDPDRPGGDARSKHDAVAVHDLTAAGRLGQRARITDLALTLQEPGLKAALQIKRAAHDDNDAEGGKEKYEPAAAGGNRDREQGRFGSVAPSSLRGGVLPPQFLGLVGDPAEEAACPAGVSFRAPHLMKTSI